MHLSHREVGQSHKMQTNWIQHAIASYISNELLQQLTMFQILLLSNAINPPNHKADIIPYFLIQLASIGHNNYIECVAAW